MTVFDDFGCVIFSPANFLGDVSPTESEIFAHATNQNINNNEKQEIRKKLLLAKIRTARRSCWEKKGRTNAWWENFITNKVTESESKDNFRMSRKSFLELCNMLRQYPVKKRTRLRTPISIDGQVGSFSYYISDESRYRKTANTSGISRASISGIIRSVSYAVTTFGGPKLVRLPNGEGQVQELTDGNLDALGFPQCIGAIDGTHIEIAEPSDQYSDLSTEKINFL